MYMQADLFITGSGSPVCEAHLERYIDDPSFRATSAEYDAWFHRHSEEMQCQRCKGAGDDRAGNTMDDALPDSNSSAWGRGTGGGGTLDEEIVRHFEEYISHASYSE
jgi:hypothetical protein